MLKEAIKIFIIFLGIVLVVVGIFGILLPILPGWIFMFLGLALLGYHPFKWLIKKTRAKQTPL